MSPRATLWGVICSSYCSGRFEGIPVFVDEPCVMFKAHECRRSMPNLEVFFGWSSFVC